MEQVKTVTRKINRSDEVLMILLSVSFGFTVFFFSPAELFIRNQKDYLLDAWHILLPMLALTLAASAVGILLFNLLYKLNETVYVVASRLATGLLLAFYVQEMFLNGKMSSITGDSFAANLTVVGFVMNLAVFLLILVVPLAGHFFRRKFPKNKFLQIGKEYIVPYFAGLIFVMQLFGMVGSIVEFGFNRYERLYDSYLSYTPSMSLSKEKNIVVFVVDRLDSFYMDEILETYPEMYDELSGFTFYQNNVSHYTNTFPSVTHMLTGEIYEGGEWKDYFKKAWGKESLIDELKKNGYKVNLFIDSTSTYSGYSDLENRCDNLNRLPESKYGFNYLRENGIVPTMTWLSFGRLVPYYAKGLFINEIKSDFSSEFMDYDGEMKDLMPGAVGVGSDLLYYDRLKDTGLNNGNSDKTFTFIHLSGAHDASNELSALFGGEYDAGTFGTLSTARGDFEIIFEYIRQMKELGVYDNTTVVILGDHGRPPLEIETKKLDHLESPIVTALLIKPENSSDAPLRIDADSELSNDYLAASILEYAGIDHSAYGYSFNDVINNDLHIERFFQTVDFNGFNHNIKFTALYSITGDARDFNNWKPV